ncbi:MAG: hypothetical protein HY565_01550 [Candidatus Kerfeldbacteria bacterium]|nr:hypothetical protein [Candidatus Kerfeldbacteria bacterium]
MDSFFTFVVWSLTGLVQMVCVVAVGYLFLAFTLPGLGTLKQRWQWYVVRLLPRRK